MTDTTVALIATAPEILSRTPLAGAPRTAWWYVEQSIAVQVRLIATVETPHGALTEVALLVKGEPAKRFYAKPDTLKEEE